MTGRDIIEGFGVGVLVWAAGTLLITSSTWPIWRRLRARFRAAGLRFGPWRDGGAR